MKTIKLSAPFSGHPPGWLSLKWLEHQLQAIGEVVMLLVSAIGFLFRGQLNFRNMLQQTAAIGFDSLPMALTICTIAGAVLSLQTAERFAMTGADSYVGGLVAMAIVREIAPIFTCLAVGARSGTAIAAELANMQVSEQVSALKVLHVDPARYLVLPRLIACLLSLPLLTMLSELSAILGGMLVAWKVTHLHPGQFLESIWLMLAVKDVWVSLLKAMVFGILMAGICCSVGLAVHGGAREVGLATTRATVYTAIGIILADFLLTWLFFGTQLLPR